MAEIFTTEVLFGLLGLAPLILYIILVFRDVEPLPATLICVVLGAILSRQTPVTFGAAIANGLSSFLGLVGLIIMLGRGVGEVLIETKVAHSMVHGIIHRIGVDSKKKAMVGIMISTFIIVAVLGTMAGGVAIIAPIIIPIAASVGLAPSVVGVLFHAVGETALILGPFAPPVVALLELTGLSLPQMMTVSLPIGALTIIATWFMSQRIQKDMEGVEAYPADLKPSEFTPDATSRRATLVFALVFLAGLVYGIVVKAGTAYVVGLMLALAIAVGFAGKLKLGEILQLVVKGMAGNMGMFLLFILLDPLLIFIEQAGGFEALTTIFRPLANIGGKAAIVIIGGLTGAFGISSAVVAELKMLHEMFLPMLQEFNVGMLAWAAALIVATRVTNFIYPGGNMFGCMGFAQSKSVKMMIRNGVVVAAIQVVLLFVYAFVFS